MSFKNGILTKKKEKRKKKAPLLGPIIQTGLSQFFFSKLEGNPFLFEKCSHDQIATIATSVN